MRLFLALELPADVRVELEGVQRELRSRCSGWRWVRPDGLHLTLRFLGEVSAEDDVAQRGAWMDAVARSAEIRFRFGGVGVFPGRSRPRVLWVGVRDDTPADGMAGLARDLERVAREIGFAAEDREFRPHLTLARGERGRRPTPPPEGFVVPEIRVVARELLLMRSDLGYGVARYTRLAAFPMESR